MNEQNGPAINETEENNQTKLQAQLEQIKRFLRKKWWMVLCAVVAVILLIVLLRNDPVQDDLTDYINNDLSEVNELEETVTELYEQARNSESDLTMYKMLDEQVIPKAMELEEKAEEITVETEEVREIHELYLTALNNNTSAFTLMLAALENQDYALLTQANEKLDAARKSMRDYEAALKALADEHGVEITYFE